MAIILESVNDQDDEYVFTPKEKTLLHALRTMLKDLPANSKIKSLNSLMETKSEQRWTDQQLLIYLEMAIGAINPEPPYTNYTLENFPSSLQTTIILGGLIFSLIAESVLQAGEAFSYSDNGISLNINLAQAYQSIFTTLLSGYTQNKINIKRAIRPKAAGIKSGAGGTSMVRIRSYAPRMWTYR